MSITFTPMLEDEDPGEIYNFPDKDILIGPAALYIGSSDGKRWYHVGSSSENPREVIRSRYFDLMTRINTPRSYYPSASFVLKKKILR